MRTADEALREHGLDGRRLVGIARDVVNHVERRTPYMNGQTRVDLESFLIEQGLQVALKYDPARSRPGYTFASYLWDVLARRVPDFYRRKSEGFGDKRSGMHDRIVLVGDPYEAMTCWAVYESGYEMVEELASLA